MSQTLNFGKQHCARGDGLPPRAKFAFGEYMGGAERSAIDLYQFTRLLNEALDDKGRHQVIQLMWEMAYVKGRLNGFEANVIWRTADLLSVPSRQRVEIRQQIAAERSILASG
jgi:uncharacterized tellurite resistance protein B-like protein